MVIGPRILERLRATGMSEAELARRVGIRQSSINALVRGETRSSRYLHQIARELGTTTAYLLGEADGQVSDAAAPPASHMPQRLMMEVTLPSEAALARMFEGLLRIVDRNLPLDEQARILARRLPTAFAQLQDLMPELATGEAHGGDEAPPVRATNRPASRRQPHT